jgi:putative endonuclease
MSEEMTTGRLGERIAERLLKGKGYKILQRNYQKNHGEIDIVAMDQNEVVFVEVKTISNKELNNGSHETYMPEFNIHKDKVRLVVRTGELYLLESRMNNDWRIDVVAVEIDSHSRKSKIRHIKSAYL